MSTRRPGAWVLTCLLVGCGADSGPRSDVSTGNDAGALAPEDDDFVGCPEPVAPFALGMRAVGDKGRLGAQLVDASRVPPLRYLNDWTLGFTRADGTALRDVKLTKARAFMPVHGHDGIVPPIIDVMADGNVRVRSLNFNMRGPWEVQLWLSAESAGDDYVVFHICVAE